jgi:hypothetical protein
MMTIMMVKMKIIQLHCMFISVLNQHNVANYKIRANKRKQQTINTK